jgi:hypothetical protein
MAKKTKRYDNGGEIVVTAPNRAQDSTAGASSYRLPAGGGNKGTSGIGGLGGRGGSESQRLAPLTMPTPAASSGARFTPAVVTQPQSALGSLVGARTPTAYGATGRFNLAEGGKVKAKKMAKGGSVSSASKRADGCVTKGKTKGKFV